MNTFEQFPEDRKCPICGTNENKPCTLIPIAGTQKKDLAQAIHVHADCIIEGHFVYSQRAGVIYLDANAEEKNAN